MTTSIRYAHRQTGWPMIAVAVLPPACLAVFGALAPSRLALPPGFVPGFAAVSAIVLVGFSSLRVVVTSTHVVARFGVGLVRRSVALDDIVSVDVTRTRWSEGWGIHWTRRGMLYNVAGFDAVQIRRRGGRALLIGSDDAGRLASVLRRAVDERRADETGHRAGADLRAPP